MTFPSSFSRALSCVCVVSFAFLSQVDASSALDLSKLPPKSEVVEPGLNDVSNLLQALYLDIERKTLDQAKIPIGAELLVEHFEMRNEHQKEIRRKSRKEILQLALGFQDDLTKWVCHELSEDQRMWLFGQLIKQHGYRSLDCGWLATGLEIDPATLKQIQKAVSEATKQMKPKKPKLTRSPTPEDRAAYARAAKGFYQDRRKLVDELIWPLLSAKQQEFIRTAEGKAE